MGTWVFDTEVFKNLGLFCAQELETERRFHVFRDEVNSVETLEKFIDEADDLIGFNSAYFDDVIVNAWLSGCSEAEMKQYANDMIEGGAKPWQINRSLNYSGFSSVDIMGASPGFVGLKALGARMHMTQLQDLPIPHNAIVSAAERQLILDYCWNDVETTVELVTQLEDQLMLRVRMSHEYGEDLRSRSDAQLAERSLSITLGLQKKENAVPALVTYTPPSFLKFTDPDMQSLLERTAQHSFEVNRGNGHVKLPDFLGGKPVQFGGGSYQLGVGGIHSTHDKKVCHVAGDDVIADIDAASFYPSIIIECGFVPSELGERFTNEFKSIYERRLKAKHAGDKNTDASLKVTINSVFGQFGNRYSVLYAPDLMLAVTLTGQFTLMMLIEWLEAAGASVLSANTDGIAVRYPKSSQGRIEEVVTEFSRRSKFVFEYTYYRTLAMKDVNSYFAIKPDRSAKVKGIYSLLSLRKNPTAQVCSIAVAEWLAHGTPFIDTIKNAPFTDFVSARSVTGGGEQNGTYLGKVVRWYQSTDPELNPLRYVKNGNKVPKTDGARACMVLKSKTVLPPDIDFEWYRRECIKIAIAIGCSPYLTEEEITSVQPVKTKKRKVKCQPST